VEPLQFVRGLWRRRWLIVAATVVGTIAGLLISLGTPRLYEGPAKVLVPSLELGPGMQLTGSAYSAIVRGPTMAANIMREFRLDRPPDSLTADDFRRTRLSVAAMPDTNIAVITVRLADPGTAARVANRVAELSISMVKEMCDNGKVRQYEATQTALKDVQRRLDDAEKRMDVVANRPGKKALASDARPDWQRLTAEIEALKARMSYLDLIVRMDGVSSWTERSLSQLRIFDPALPPSGPIGTSTLRRVLAGGVAGYLLALVGVLFFDALRMTVLRRRS
jgi:uncharacterized protein involved in exopolysaccharide biosynthesis